MTLPAKPLVAGGAGLLLGCLIGFSFGGSTVAGPDAAAQAEGDQGSSRGFGPVVSSAELREIRARLDALAAGQRRIEGEMQRRAAAPAQRSLAADVPEPAAAASGAAAPSVEALVEVLRVAEERRRLQSFARLSPGQLAAQWERLIEQGEFGAAQQAFDELMARDLEPERRTDLMCRFGEMLRETEQLDQSADLLQRAMDLAPPGSEQHSSAALELAWTRLEQGDPRAALRLADQAAASDQVDGEFRAWARFSAAVAAQDSGDEVRARRDFEALIAEFADDPEMRWVVRESREHLEDMR